MEPKTHELKTWPEFFYAVAIGMKTFELRKNDRNFRPGDIVCLREYLPDEARYTGRELTYRIGYLLPGGNLGLPDDMCIFSLLQEGWA